MVGLVGADGGTLANDFNADHTLGIDFNDDTRANDRVTVAHNATEGLAAASSLAAYAISRSATATVTDQFGDAITGDTVTFTGSADLGVASVHTTNNLWTIAADKGLMDGDIVRFLDLTGCTATNNAIDTTYYVDWVSTTTFALSASSTLSPLVAASAIDADCGAAVLVKQHHITQGGCRYSISGRK